MLLYPIKLRPHLAKRVWGSSDWAQSYLKESQDCSSVGEIWNVYGECLVAEGAYEGLTLDSLYCQFPRELGFTTESPHFPLLIKWLRAQRWLSLQVHPDTELARELTGRNDVLGKTEAWYVTQAQPDAELILGVHPQIGFAEFLQSNGREWLDLVERVCPKVGDCYNITPGTIHALGPGVTVLEVQQSSNLTYRLYDWDRLGLDGKPRELHLQEAQAVLKRHWQANCEAGKAQETELAYAYPKLEGRSLVVSKFFRMELFDKAGSLHWQTSLSQPEILICVKGKAEAAVSGNCTDLSLGEACIMAAGGAEITVNLNEESQLIRVTQPQVKS